MSGKINSDLLNRVSGVHRESARTSVLTPRLTWTSEQQQFFEMREARIVLTALAGTGKSSSLLEYARRNGKPWTLLAFNRAVAERLAVAAPKNVRVMTAHALAFAVYGKALAGKLDRPDGDTEGREGAISALIRDGLDRYCQSSDDTPGLTHINPDKLQAVQARFAWDSLDGADMDGWLKTAWRRSLDPQDDYGISHDVYLKRFCLDQSAWPGERWMLDEAQDWTPCFNTAWARCTGIGVRAGDPFQQLYGWRGSQTGAWIQPGEKEAWLTRSMRTGADLQGHINALLRRLGCARTWQAAQHACPISTAASDAAGLRDFRPDIILADRWDRLEGVAPMVRQAGFRVRWLGGGEGGENLDDAGSGPAIWLGTIFGAKGMEWDRVWLTDNYLAEPDPAQRLRLAYVAATRARQAIRLPGD